MIVIANLKDRAEYN